MKRKSLPALCLCLILMVIMSAVCAASSAKEEATAYLKQAAENMAKADNFTYDINMTMTGPLADCKIDADGTYSGSALIAGRAETAFDLWILNMTFNMTDDYYLKLNDESGTFYFKVNTVSSPMGNAAVNDDSLKMNQWYVQELPLPKETLQQLKDKQTKTSFTKDLKKIFMYKPDKDTVKIYASYDIPLTSKGELEQMIKTDGDNPKAGELHQQMRKYMEDNAALRKALFKPRSLTYEITVDDSTQQINEVSVDMTQYIRQAGSDVLDAIPFEDMDEGREAPAILDGTSLRSIAKNYLKRSTMTVDIKFSDIGTTKATEIPQQVIDSAIAPPEKTVSEPKPAETAEETELKPSE